MNTLKKLHNAIAENKAMSIGKLVQKLYNERILSLSTSTTIDSQLCVYQTSNQNVIANCYFYPNLGYANIYIRTPDNSVIFRKFKSFSRAKTFVRSKLTSLGYILLAENES